MFVSEVYVLRKGWSYWVRQVEVKALPVAWYSVTPGVIHQRGSDLPNLTNSRIEWQVKMMKLHCPTTVNQYVSERAS